jgi:predicted acyl esterase
MSRFRPRPATLAFAAVLASSLAACGGSGGSGPGATPAPGPAPTPSPGEPSEEPRPADYSARGSVEQLYVLGAEAGQTLELLGPGGAIVATGTADEMGAYLFRGLEPGSGYVVASGSGADREASGELAVTAPVDVPDPSFYESQEIGPGYGYLETRDGTLLAVNVFLPGPPENGPYPTVIEYSGYDPANPDAPQPSTLIATALGYAAVGVNMRGTGCSGGAFQFFETLQSTDGYDVVEVIAAQPWAKDHEVGMVGLSYPGISQLFVAQLNPPSLASIAPLSVIADTGRGVLFPGGIYNDGFAKEWAEGRRRDAEPFGQGWSAKRRDEGDQTCIDNQQLRFQSPDILAMIDENRFYVPAVADPVTPALFVHRIDVPVFLAGAWQDEQTGAYFATMLDDFTGTDRKHFTAVNGAHTDPLGPAIFSRWMEFLSFYVRKEIPQENPVAPVILDVLRSDIFQTDDPLTLEPLRFADAGSFAEAIAAFESDPPLRVLFDNGAGGRPGAPVPAFEAEFDAWPVPGLTPAIWYFDGDGELSPRAPTGDGADEFRYDPSRSQETSLSGGTSAAWVAMPDWHWLPPDDGTALAYATAPLDEDVVMVGSGSVDLWFQSTASDVDIQVTLSEITPDGDEVYIQNGWLRASRRKVDEATSTELRPFQLHFEADAEPLPDGEFALTRIEIFPFAHVFRAGSRIRILVAAPGRDRSHWRFDALAADGEVTNTVSRSAAMPSRIVLPLVPGIDVPTPRPACGVLRGQPCRPYEELANLPG